MDNLFGIVSRKKDFYERHIGDAVNLFVENGLTYSGDIKEYDRLRGLLVLTNYICRIYNLNGTSEFVEYPGEIELEVSGFRGREESTKEDRLGRIVKYNKDLETHDKLLKEVPRESTEPNN